MFAAAALPVQFRGPAFRSLLLAAINADDVDRTSRRLRSSVQFEAVTTLSAWKR